MPSFLLAAEESSGGLIDVVPGLMIWTLICFAITFFVLRRYAFGPIQKTIDERRDRIRAAVDEADKARDEARELLEQHRQLIADAKGEAAGILADARKVADAQFERVKEESEVERARRLEETKRQIDAETKRSLDLIRSEVADLTLEATARVTGKVLDAEDQRRLIDEAISELDFSALEKEARPLERTLARLQTLRMPSSQSPILVCASRSAALCEAATGGPSPRSDAGRAATVAAPRRSRAIEEVPELRAFLRNPQIEPTGKAAVLEQLATDADELVRNFVRLVAEKGRAGEIPEISAELDALVAQAQNRLAVELTTSYELSDEEARSIVKTIETASGRTVEATRSVDPSLIGGIVLQIGSHRADGSVRGRLERLRHELATAQ